MPKYRYKHSQGYIEILTPNRERMLEHRYIWEKHNGKIPEGFDIHHKNHIKNDNRIENLELISKKEHGKLSSMHLIKKPIIKNCDFCEKQFSGIPWTMKKRHFCSQPCYWSAKSTNPEYLEIAFKNLKKVTYG
ncbi:MAG: HNH endonuclease signature motif containing protein [Nanoarchaeota archaeon]